MTMMSPGFHQRFRWGRMVGRGGPEGSLFRILPWMPRGWGRPALILAWLAGLAVRDLTRQDSRILTFARRLLLRSASSPRVDVKMVLPPAIAGPDRPGKMIGTTNEPKK